MNKLIEKLNNRNVLYIILSVVISLLVGFYSGRYYERIVRIRRFVGDENNLNMPRNSGNSRPMDGTGRYNMQAPVPFRN